MCSGIQSWTRNCHIVHASSENASGPFTYRDTPVGPFSCNPHAIVLPNGSLALFHIGVCDQDFWTLVHWVLSLLDFREGQPRLIQVVLMGCVGTGVGSASVNCTNKAPYGNAPLPKEHWPSQSVRATVHTSSGVDGPWTASPSDLSCNNPAPAVHPNGTVYVVCHGGSLHGQRGGSMQTLYGGPTEHGPWRQVSTMQFGGTTITGSPQRPNSAKRYSTVWEGATAIVQGYHSPNYVFLSSCSMWCVSQIPFCGSTHKQERFT